MATRDQAAMMAHRLRAALAEVGYDSETLGEPAVEVCYHADRIDGPWGVRYSLLIPEAIAWRAGHIARSPFATCLACFSRFRDVRIRAHVGCLDPSFTQLDCGLDRDAAVSA